MKKQRYYACIDMKSFFASVECAERGLNPFEANLVVADTSRGEGTICLAVTPKMKALGVKNRCRLYEIPKNIEYIAVKPRMQKYIDCAAEIYGIYLDYMDKQDIYVYSIDECFLDITDYLSLYSLTPKQFAQKLMGEIAARLRVPATAGIGTNLYLAKIALDITAKRVPDRIGYLDEELFQKTLWNHRPLTDFWGIATGISNRLKKYGIYDMQGITRYPEGVLYREFGVNAELLIDHAYGRESCTMADIKNYKAKHHSISHSQILFEDYTFERAKIVLEEMIRSGCLEMVSRGVVTNRVAILVGYSKNAKKAVNGGVRMHETTNLPKLILPYAMDLFRSLVERDTPIRKIGIAFEGVYDEIAEGYDLFTDVKRVEREKKLTRATLELQKKFGKNAVIMATDLQEGATLRERNAMIGGHASGNE